MKFQALTPEQADNELLQQRYLEFKFAPLWRALEENGMHVLKISCEDGQTPTGLRMSLTYAARKMKKKVRFLTAGDHKSVLVIKE